jgi:hypothetical protein
MPEGLYQSASSSIRILRFANNFGRNVAVELVLIEQKNLKVAHTEDFSGNSPSHMVYDSRPESLKPDHFWLVNYRATHGIERHTVDSENFAYTEC